MGDTAQLPSINEIAFFLRENAPSTVEELEARGPIFRDLLQLGVPGGGSESVAEEGRRAGVAVRCEILARALSTALTRAQQRATVTENKIKQLRTLRFLSSVGSALSSSGAAGSALLGKETSTIVLSILALVSTIASTVASTLVLGTGKKESDLIAFLQTFARSRAYCELAQAQLKMLPQTGVPLTEIATLLKEGNSRFQELNDAFAKANF